MMLLRLIEPPQIPRRAGRTLDQLTRDRILRLEQGRERGLLGPAGRTLLQVDRLLGKLLAGVDVPRRRLLRSLDAEKRLAQLRQPANYAFARFLQFVLNFLLGHFISSKPLMGSFVCGSFFSDGLFSGRSFSGSLFTGLPFSGSLFTCRSFSVNSFPGRSFTGRPFSGSLFSGRSFSGNSFAGRPFSGSLFTGSPFSGSLFA